MIGHVEKKVRNGKVRYYPVVELGSDPGTGKRLRKWHEGYARKKDAQKALTNILAERMKHNWVEPSKQTVGEYLSEWLATARATVRPSTWDSYRRALNTYVVPHIGAVQLMDLDGSRLDRLYAKLLVSGATRKAELSPRTVRYAHTVLHRALKDGVRKRRLSMNPADFADPPRLQTPEMKTWTAAQARTFLSSVSGDRLYACYLLALTTGMRKGELLGLRWYDVDLAAGQLSVRHTLIQIGYEVAASAPKTRTSRRPIPIDRVTVEALVAYKVQQDKDRQEWGPCWAETGLVFTRENGTLVHPDHLDKAFKRHAAAASLPRIRLHDLRHTYATLALKAGVHPKIVSERLGHATIRITLDTYSHVLPSMQTEAATLVARLLTDPDFEAPDE